MKSQAKQGDIKVLNLNLKKKSKSIQHTRTIDNAEKPEVKAKR